MYLGDVPDAVAHFRRATELDPLSVPTLAWYGMALYFDKHYAEARTVLRDTLALDPNRSDARYHLILVDERLARVDEARALVRNPQSAANRKSSRRCSTCAPGRGRRPRSRRPGCRPVPTPSRSPHSTSRWVVAMLR